MGTGPSCQHPPPSPLGGDAPLQAVLGVTLSPWGHQTAGQCPTPHPRTGKVMGVPGPPAMPVPVPHPGAAWEGSVPVPVGYPAFPPTPMPAPIPPGPKPAITSRKAKPGQALARGRGTRQMEQLPRPKGSSPLRRRGMCVGGGCRSQHPPRVEMPVQTSPPGAGRGSGRVPAEPASSRPLPVPPRACGLTPPGPAVRDASRAGSLPAGSTGFTAGQGTGPPWGTTSPRERDAPHTTTGLGGHEATVTAGRAARSYDRGARATSTHRRAAYQCCRAIHSHLERREGGGLAPGCRWPCPLCPAV